MNIKPANIIKTTFLGPTKYKGARLHATCQAGSITLNHEYELNAEDISWPEIHWSVAKILLLRLQLNWGPVFVMGKDKEGFYFIPREEANLVSLQEQTQ